MFLVPGNEGINRGYVKFSIIIRGTDVSLHVSQQTTQLCLTILGFIRYINPIVIVESNQEVRIKRGREHKLA